jgi:hypothetical protein
MAKRNTGGKQTSSRQANAQQETAQPAGAGTDAMEQRVIAFAEQLGRIVGTVQAQAEGWMDRDALNKQIASVRDGASELLEQLSGSVTSLTNAASKATGIGAADASAASTPSKKSSGAAAKGRSGGVVDAPGKKHRKAPPKDPRMMAADTARNINRGRQSLARPGKRNGRG